MAEAGRRAQTNPLGRALKQRRRAWFQDMGMGHGEKGASLKPVWSAGSKFCGRDKKGLPEETVPHSMEKPQNERGFL